MTLILHWIVSTIAVLIGDYLIPGVSVNGFGPAFVVAVVLGALNLFLKPILIILTLPINILTLGLFTLVINTLLVLLTAKIVPGFSVNSFGSAFLFGIVMTVVGWALHTYTF